MICQHFSRKLIRTALWCVSVTALFPRFHSWAEEKTATGGSVEAGKSAFNLIEQQTLDLGDRWMIYRRITPPLLGKRPAPVLPAVLSPEESAMIQRRASKEHEIMFLAATVYDRAVTELRIWRGDGKGQLRAFSNIDFNLFAGLGEFETAEKVYWLFFGLGNETTEDVEAANRHALEQNLGHEVVRKIPGREAFSEARAEYVIANGDEGLQEVSGELAALDALHVFFDAQRANLLELYARREARRIAQEDWQRAHPPQPKNSTVHFWPKQSRVYPGGGK